MSPIAIFRHEEPILSSDPSCHSIGISGGCGGDCPILREGRCETQGDMETALPIADQERLGRERMHRFIQTRGS